MKTNFDSDNILSIARVFERNLSINRSSYFDSHLLEELILHYIEEEQLALATRACDTGMQLFPFSSEFLRLKAKTLAEARDYDHALELVEQSKMLDGESIQNCMEKCNL